MLQKTISRSHSLFRSLTKIIVFVKIITACVALGEDIKYKKLCSPQVREHYFSEIRQFLDNYFEKNSVSEQYTKLHKELQKKGVKIIHPGIQALCSEENRNEKEALISSFDNFLSSTFENEKCLLSFNVMMTASSKTFENNINILHKDLIKAYNDILCAQ